MKVVWKFKIEHRPEQSLAIPEGAQILALQTQFGDPHLWVLVDPTTPPELRTFMLVGTGHNIGDPPSDMALSYVGSYQMQGGAYVFHLFEVTHVKQGEVHG